MLEMILDRHIIYVLLGIMTAVGVVSKCIANVSLKRLVRGAGNMNKSTHPLMRLVRAKFEHACMISEKVENVGVFVDKYLYEYRVIGIKLHTWQRAEKAAAGICLFLGLVGAFFEYSAHGLQDGVLKIGAAGAGLGILIYLFHLTTDENYRMEAAKNYMVDYLENVCLHRYEKVYQKEIKVMGTEAAAADFGMVADDRRADAKNPDESDMDRTFVEEEFSGKEEADRAFIDKLDAFDEKKDNKAEPQRPHPGREVPSPRTSPEITPPAMPDPYPVPDVTPPIRGIEADSQKVSMAGAMAKSEKISAADARRETARTSRQEERKEPVNKDALIRQILEEFMA